MSMRIVNLVQGTPEWRTHRRAHFNASDAPAMMACSSYKTRAQLIKELATGISEEVDAATQRRFDAGHQFEAMARPLAEEIIGDELSPCVGTESKYSASFDGLTFMNDVAFEHKTLNNALREAMVQGCTGVDLPLQYQVQMEQQAMVSGCERILFMASTWNSDGSLIEERHCWYVPNLQLRAQIVAGWEQLEQEVTAFDPNAERQAPAVAEPVESLPAVAVQLQGSLVVVSNLDKVAVAVRAFIDGMVAKPSTDQEFADAEAECKALKSGEEAMKAAVAGALAQVSDVEAFTRTANDLANLMRTTRLAREKLVAAEKDARRLAVVTDAQQELDQHVAALNKRLGAGWLPRMAGGFTEIIKGKKSLANMQDAVAVALTNAKAQANGLAQRLEANRAHLVQQDGDLIALFADFATVGTKAAEDFHALAALRIGNHRTAETKRLEAERELIRQEEQQRADAEMREKLIQAEAQAQAGIDDARSANELPGPLLDDLSSLAKGLRDSGVAEIDTRHAIAAAQTSAAAAVSDDGRTMTLGQINALIAPIKVDAAGLAELGFVATTIKAAKHYPARSVPHILAAMIKRLQGVMATA